MIGGPTASGKSELALQLADEIPCEIINADSRQIYQRLTIGTSQPSSSQKQQVPHHLYGFLDPRDSFTAADYERIVSELIPQIVSRNRLPVLIGGTGFYMKAVLRGVWPVSARNDQLRSRLRMIDSRHHKLFLHNMLMRLDPVSGAAIAPPDTYRIIRALEIYFESGVRRSDLPRNQAERYQALKYYLEPPREQLHQNIESRTERMLHEGWVEEVKEILRSYPDFSAMPSSRSLGYQEILRYLQGEMNLEQCKDSIVIKTRQYAKRQLTWFRNQDQFEAITPDVPLRKIIDCVIKWYQK